ncbi:hypothetical protein R3P38DRAFT_2816715 [Favolaschia claudopus]|uniref:Uncharacterized protein n=1 Tax=Favolaschia claudopus TaxID=2862362 RepID=A0AAV9YZ56_9AGAR
MVLTWSNTAIEAVRNAQGNAKARMLSFGKETVDQAIQQGNARVSNGNQQDIGELAAHSCPLERNGQQHIKKYDSRQSTQAAYFDFYKTTPHQANLYHRKDIRLSSYKEQRCLIVHTSTGLQGLRLSLRPSTDSYLTRELGTQFHAKGPKTRGIRGNNDSVGGNRGATPKKRLQNRGNRGQQLESGATRILPELSE